MKLTRVVNSIAFVNSKVFLIGVASTGAKDCALGQRVLEPTHERAQKKLAYFAERAGGKQS